jgi:hypothetical protein
MAGRYSERGANLEIFLKAHSGDHCSVDRIGRPSYVLHAPALTFALTVQPAVIAGLATTSAFRGRGLLARFLYAVPESRVGMRSADPTPVPSAVRDAYAAAVTRLLQLAEHEKETVVVDMSREARSAHTRFKAMLEPRLGPTGDLHAIADWGNKLVGAVARLAALLHVAQHEDALVMPVSEDAVVHAIGIAEYLVAHARAAFSLMGADPAIEDAKHVLRRILDDGRDRITKRDIFRRAQSERFERADDLDPPLRILVDRGYLREVEVPVEGPKKGRPPSPTYEVNPRGR